MNGHACGRRTGADMDIKATLKPGMNGTKALLREYGEQLVCVRYRYDKARHGRYKTVELVVANRTGCRRPDPRQRCVYICISYGERELRQLVKLSGGCRIPEREARHLPFGKVIEPGLEQRILVGHSGHSACAAPSGNAGNGTGRRLSAGLRKRTGRSIHG